MLDRRLAAASERRGQEGVEDRKDLEEDLGDRKGSVLF